MTSASPAPFPRRKGEVARAKIRDFFVELRRAGQRPPTVDEIHAGTGIATRTLRYHLAWMVRAGELSRLPGARGFELPIQQQ